MLDRLPPAVRHLFLMFAAVLVAFLANAVIDAGGVTGVSWGDALVAALNAAATAAAGVVLLIVTPATRQYGVGSR